MCRSLIGALVKCQDHLSDHPDDCELASVNWVIMPLLNPDGYRLVLKLEFFYFIPISLAIHDVYRIVALVGRI